MAFPPLFVAFLAFLLDLVRVGRFIDGGHGNRGNADEAPSLIGLFDNLADDKRRERADCARPVSDGAGRVMASMSRIVRLVGLIATVWLCCWWFHFAHRLG